MEYDTGGACSMHEEMRNSDNIFVGKPEGREHMENLCIIGRKILKLIL